MGGNPTYFYEILASTPKYHGEEALTYSSDAQLQPGLVVSVPLRNQKVLGIVLREVRKPTFKTKAITQVITSIPLPAANLQLMDWLRQYYPAPSGVITGLFVPGGLLQKARAKDVPPVLPAQLTTLPPLTAEQQSAVHTILDKVGTALLHGDTGTGKTRVYLELAQATLQAGRSALILTPEIGLTPQLTQTFVNTFGDRIIIVHSHLTPAERRDNWLKILEAAEPVLVIGARSALFSPFQDLGLIVIDEAHETAYKQEQAPYYQTLRVAAKLSQLTKARLVIGTATPPVNEYYLAEATDTPILRMRERPAGEKLNRDIKLINLRDREHFSKQPHLSNELIEAVRTALGNGEQALIFLNRRGTARLVFCQDCGWQALCPNCDLPLTYHGDSHSMRCHTCGHKELAPGFCPNCHSTDIIFKSIGTKAIYEEISREFPQAKIRRFDTDNLKAERFEAHYDDVAAGKVDILVGTQMLAKGLDLPKLAVVGVVIADTSLYFPDYSAEERTYQLLHQVIGRVGRGHRHGTVVIQSYNPASAALEAVLSDDWPTFYKRQLDERRQFLFPPFVFALKLHTEKATPGAAMSAADKLHEQIQLLRLPVSIVGPSPAFHEKFQGRYRWQIIVKAKDRRHLLKIIPGLPAGWSYDLDPTNLL